MIQEPSISGPAQMNATQQAKTFYPENKQNFDPEASLVSIPGQHIFDQSKEEDSIYFSKTSIPMVNKRNKIDNKRASTSQMSRFSRHSVTSSTSQFMRDQDQTSRIKSRRCILDNQKALQKQQALNEGDHINVVKDRKYAEILN